MYRCFDFALALVFVFISGGGRVRAGDVYNVATVTADSTGVLSDRFAEAAHSP